MVMAILTAGGGGRSVVLEELKARYELRCNLTTSAASWGLTEQAAAEL